MKIAKSKSLIVWLCVTSFLFFIFSTLNVLKENIIFPLANALLLGSYFFVFKGKYRLYAFVVSITMIPLFSSKSFIIGSFYTFLLLLYIIFVAVETIINPKNMTYSNMVILLAYLTIIVYCFLIQFIGGLNIPKYFSTCIYWAIPLIFVFDNKSQKKLDIILYIFAFSFFISNLFYALFIYFIPGQAINFLQIYQPSYITMYQKFGIQNFRFPGFSGDPNHLGIIALAIGILLFSYSYYFKKKYVLSVLLGVGIQIFGFLGGSKTYLASLAILILLICFLIIIRSKKPLLYFLIALFSFLIILSFVLSINSLSKTILRFLYIDDRQGFLEALTTERLSLWKIDLSFLLGKPLYLLFGQGVWSKTLFGAAAHNSYIQILWDLGLIGAILLISYFSLLFKKIKEFKILKFLILFLLIIYSLGLHIIYNENFIICIAIAYIFSSKKIQSSNTIMEVSI